MRYRKDIDGLRAVAVAPVILFHAGIPGFAGGYVGVDVFFVISGFLITSILLEDLQGDRFSIVRFYERRARRILPALVFVCLCCLPLAATIMVPQEIAEFSASLRAVALFFSNVHFWLNSGYFDTAAELRPLLHTWSLAVEEQFYILFPPFLWLVWKLGRHGAVAAVTVVVLGSLVLSQMMAPRFPLANFFLLPSRAWELGIGALCAFAVQGGRVRASPWAPWVGLAMIGAAVALFDETTPFPSVYALLPVLGTALVILYGGGSGGAVRLLSLRPVVGLGLISYSAYLWHQPLFAFARIGSVTPPGLGVMLGLSLLAVVLAALSWRFVEQPFRHGGAPLLARRSRLFGVSALGLAALLLAGQAGVATGGWRDLWMRLSPPDLVANYRLIEAVEKESPDRDAKDCLFHVARPEPTDPQLQACFDLHGPGVAILGDSHGMDLFNAIETTTGAPFVASFAEGGCRPHTPRHFCRFKEFLALLEAQPELFKLVIFEQAGFYLMQGEGYDHGQRGMLADLPIDVPVPDFIPNTDWIDRNIAYLEQVAARTRLVWFGPRLEPHFPARMILRAGCTYPYALRDNQRAVFDRLEAEIEARLAGTQIEYLSQNRLAAFSFPEDLMSCDVIYWSSGDHFSAAGERYFGTRFRLPERLLEAAPDGS